MRIATCALSLGLFTQAACGGGDPPPKTPSQETDDDGSDRVERPPLDVSAEIGALDEGAVTKTFEAALPDLEACMKTGANRVEFIGGAVQFSLKINQGGSLTEAYLERTTLGDRDTEKCLLTALGKRTWPAPQGGVHGLAHKGFEFDMVNDVRPPVIWDSSEVQETLDTLGSKISECKSGTSGDFEVTMYIGTRGQVLGAGVAQSNASDDTAADCLVDVLKEGKYKSPGSWPAKVSFHL
ncbi:MAG: hypothetical protein H6718_02270 [Polyangiaceae bacterium]|nr:hypothetical protein [Myxococcales bacterium]MCB9584189.1 hypothetical protein [Polyangiaceae bacterium]MCB9608649.1 hypothetical protein [Polyangiaceae bacterium]